MLIWMNLNGKALRQVDVDSEKQPTNSEFRQHLLESFSLASDSVVRLRSPDGPLIVCNARSVQPNTRQRPYRLEVVSFLPPKPPAAPNAVAEGEKSVAEVKLEGLGKRLDKVEALFEEAGHTFPSHEKLLALQSSLAFAKRLLESMPEPSLEMNDEIPQNWQSPFW